MSSPLSSISEIYGATFACECGRTHTVLPEAVFYEPDAAARCPELVLRATEPWGRGALPRRVAVLADRRTHAVAGEAVCLALHRAGVEVSEVVLPDPPLEGTPVCDDETLALLQEAIGEVDLILPVGGGVLSDLGKWLAWERKLPFITFGTAASMNGYASANVAPRIAGIKSLVRARPPRFVLADPEVLRAAPWRLTAAGLGDVVAKLSSSVDWALNHRLFGDYYCQASVDLIAEIEPLYLDAPEALRAGDPQATRALFEALLLTGVAMTMAETSAPASGGEHLISHTLDMTAAAQNSPHDLHGRQVGVGTQLAMALYHRLLNLPDSHWAERGWIERAEGADVAYWGALADGVAQQTQLKRARRERAVERLSEPGFWEELRAELAERLPPPGRVASCLRRAEAAVTPQDIGCSSSRLEEALIHAAQMRERFTVLDLAELSGLLPELAAELVAEL